MKQKKVIILLVLFALLFLLGCVSNSNTQKISDIKSNPADFSDKEVSLQGTVTRITATLNTPPTAGFKFGTLTLILNDGTGEILVRAIFAEEIDAEFVSEEPVPKYDNTISQKVTIPEGTKLLVTGTIEYLPHAAEPTQVTLRAIRITRQK